MHSTLLLNADGNPISLLPLSSVSWQDAMRLLYLDAAESLHPYDDWTIHAPRIAVPVPAVAILRHHVAWRPQVGMRNAIASFVFLRDNYTCQYCGQMFSRDKLTLDHVLPRKFGGRSVWNNLATACEPCNGRRGHDMSIQPLRQPQRPTHAMLVNNLKKLPLTVPHESWNWYLGWPEAKLILCDPRSRQMRMPDPALTTQ